MTLSPNETVQVVDDISNPTRSCEPSLCDAEDEETRRIQEEQDAVMFTILYIKVDFFFSYLFMVFNVLFHVCLFIWNLNS